MKRVTLASLLFASIIAVAGCATDSEMTQKEKDQAAREMAKQEKKQAQEQQKMMGGTNQGTGMRRSR